MLYIYITRALRPKLFLENTTRNKANLAKYRVTLLLDCHHLMTYNLELSRLSYAGERDLD